VSVRRIAALLLLFTIGSSSLEGLWSVEHGSGDAAVAETLDDHTEAIADTPSRADDPCPCLCDCSCPGAQLVVGSAPRSLEFGVGAVTARPPEDDRSDPLLEPRPNDRPPLR